MIAQLNAGQEVYTHSHSWQCLTHTALITHTQTHLEQQIKVANKCSYLLKPPPNGVLAQTPNKHCYSLSVYSTL